MLLKLWWLLLLSSYVLGFSDESEAVELEVLPQMVWDVLELDAQEALEGIPLVAGLVFFTLLHLGELGSQSSFGLVYLACFCWMAWLS